MVSKIDRLIPKADEITVESASVIIIGAGPVGLFLALKLVKAGISVIVLESEREVAQSPRATTYMPIVLHELKKVGLYEDLEKAGVKNKNGITFRKSHAKGGEVLGSLQMSQISKGSVQYDFAGIHLGQHKLVEIILSHCVKEKNFQIHFGHRFAGTQQKDPKGPVDVTVVGPRGEKFFKCDVLVGADGAGSSVRRSQCIPFEGFTWQDFRFVACNVNYDFEAHGGFTTANMIVDEEDWAVITRTGPGDAPWRVAFGVRTNIPESEILNQIPEKYERLLPGPRPLKYELVNANPYWAHQRVAKTWKVGNVVLCGDAGHSNNPIGGLGLMTGLLDSAALGNCLIRIFKHKEDSEELLERYARVRRDAWINFSNPQSIEFKLRLHSFEPEVEDSRKAFFDALNNDPSINLKMATMMNQVNEDEFALPDGTADEAAVTEGQNVEAATTNGQ